MNAPLYPECRRFDIAVGGHSIHGVTGGNGPPLLLLHGYPQTHAMWHKVFPLLSDRFTIVAPDLTGYGNSGKPPSDEHHTPYSKRAMATDMLKVMLELGHGEFYLAGHDRGGRVAHRLAVDHVKHVKRLAVLDIAPTREMYANTGDEFARAYWHWFFLIQAAPFPESMINADPDAYIRHKCGLGTKDMNIFTEQALECYLQAFRNPETVHASCEDYRAAASIDIVHDDEDDKLKRKIECPLLVLWGADGVIERCFDPMALWKRRANHVSGSVVPGGHFLAEQHPERIARSFLDFFSTENP